MHPPVTHVVELENNRIRLAAVDARMLTEVLPSSVLVFLSGPIVVPSDLGQLVLAIPQVPVVFVFPHAGTTPALPFSGLSRQEAEFIRRFAESTSCATTLAVDEIGTRVLAEPEKGVLPFVYAECPCRLSRVAVRATHCALGYLALDRCPGTAARD